jgi:hypothetical protein
MKPQRHSSAVLSSTKQMALSEVALQLALQLRPAGKGGEIAVLARPRRSDPAPAHSCVTGVGSAVPGEAEAVNRRQGGAVGPGERREQVWPFGRGPDRGSDGP